MKDRAQQRALGRLLCALREQAEISQQELARRLGCSQTRVSKWETGERRVDVVEYIKICHAIDTDPIRLIRSLIRRSR